jgi:primosomal protein N' (replication factor Y)
MPVYAQVAVNVPVHHPFTYSIPDELVDRIAPGHLVHAPFRNRSKTGLVLELVDELDDPDIADRIKPLIDRVDPDPLLNQTDLEFLEFISNYYMAPIGQVVQLAVPSAVQLEGLKHYRLSEETGAEPQLEEPLRKAIDHLENSELASIEELKDLHSDLTFTQLSELEDRGIVEVEYHQSGSNVGPKREKFYRIVEPPSENDRIGKKQARILELLDTDEATPLSDIRNRVDSPYSSLDGLVDRGFLEVESREIYRDPFASEPVPEPDEHVLTDAQREALDTIRSAQSRSEYEGFVLHGVTGSGKTEVYMRAIRDAVQEGERALVLLPEIALTPQFVAEFRGHFDDSIAVQHSGLTPAERFDQWRRIKRDEVDIVIGARSALFAPLSNLGVIVVDEEHDTSFKQERGPRYNARDMALVRGKLESARVILGSATPSLESYYNSKYGDRLTYLAMPERVEDHPMPDVEIVDMRGRGEDSSPSHVLSPRLYHNLEETLDDDKQAILFLNRRGFSPCVICDNCGHVFECTHCDVSLTYHRRQEALRCHHCDYSLRMPEACPQCGNDGLDSRGIGTEQLETHLENLFGDATIARLDRDTTTGKQVRELIGNFRDEQIDILAGTQMVTKGHDFPGVVTVGVVLADLSLNFPDFRSNERTFQLLTQVSGRAGRGEEVGRVYIQSYNPDHYAIRAAAEHDYEQFAEQELSLRKELSYPPYGHLIAIKFESKNNSRATQAARDYASAVRSILRNHRELAEETFMLGPAMAPLARLKGRSRWQLLLKGGDRSRLRETAGRMLEAVDHFDPHQSDYSDVRIIVDVDPVNML